MADVVTRRGGISKRGPVRGFGWGIDLETEGGVGRSGQDLRKSIEVAITKRVKGELDGDLQHQPHERCVIGRRPLIGVLGKVPVMLSLCNHPDWVGSWSRLAPPGPAFGAGNIMVLLVPWPW
jgi:hypothetical protein